MRAKNNNHANPYRNIETSGNRRIGRTNARIVQHHGLRRRLLGKLPRTLPLRHAPALLRRFCTRSGVGYDDMHLHYSDAFAHEVESVTLYAFDESGKFVQQFTDSGEALQQEGYALPFELPAGTYQFVAWCGVENELQSHDVPTLTPGVSTVEELTCTINREYDENRQATVEEIAPVFHAFVPHCTLPDEPGTHDIDIPLTKDTKTVRIVLQHLSGEPIDVNRFSFQITDENGLMAHDNSLLDDELLHYQPYYTASGTADMNSDGSRATTAISTALAELTVGRLVKDKDTRTILTVHNDKGETVLSIPDRLRPADKRLLQPRHVRPGIPRPPGRVQPDVLPR